MQISRTNSKNSDFKNLVKELDDYLKITDVDEHSFYNQFNNIDGLNYVVVCYIDDSPVGCGAIKKFHGNTMEVKRMFVSEEYRNQGVAQKNLIELESWTKELG